MIPPVVSIIANSGTGKTTLIEKLIKELKQRGYLVGVVKHDAHRFSIDHEGKDSWRFTRAGADIMLLTSKGQIAMVRQHLEDDPELTETIATYCKGLDIVITEGFKDSTMAKIEVHRKECGSALLSQNELHKSTIIAVASDEPLDMAIPVYDVNDFMGLSDFIVERFLA